MTNVTWKQSYECTGEGVNGDHCCYQAGKPCDYIVENQAGRRYACGLLLKYGSWEKMNESPEYKPIGEHWSRNGSLPFNYCELFDPAFCCRPEYRNGRHNENCEPGCADRVGDH